jgi:hypothetical protein
MKKARGFRRAPLLQATAKRQAADFFPRSGLFQKP